MQHGHRGRVELASPMALARPAAAADVTTAAAASLATSASASNAAVASAAVDLRLVSQLFVINDSRRSHVDTSRDSDLRPDKDGKRNETEKEEARTERGSGRWQQRGKAQGGAGEIGGARRTKKGR